MNHSTASSPGSLIPECLNSITFKALTDRIVTIAAHMQSLMDRSAALEQAAQNKPLSVKEQKEYINLGTELDKYELLFADIED